MTSRPPVPRPPVRAVRSMLIGLAAGLVAVAAVWFAMAPVSPGGQAAASIGGPFQLTDGAGQTVTDRSFQGKFMLVYFGYTTCPDVCPTTLNTMAAALDALGPRSSRVQPLFITVDPARDTVPVVHDYAAAFGPRIDGLTGTPQQIAAVAKAYRVYYAKHVTGPAPGDYTMDHSSVVYLMGPDGRFVSVIRADEAAADMAADIAKHLT